ncbi:hypothetical protein EV683_11134 [Crenobacter luteus]|uniref:DUF1365 domain-containing protein n=1 Tax=Crenobacter luteus TaxID=1452487 RepID=UPI0010471430|nr:DUF1365 domain-containing protein [Crenobacter luteus]TCP11810.1 hypothetical protein EV683_11134 [Crenobacter luteus]
MNACVRLFRGTVWHARHAVAEHAFRYPHGWIAVALPQADEPVLRLGPALSWRREHHGPCDGAPLWPWLSERLAEQGLAAAARAELHTMPALFGRVFNPVSFYFVYDERDALVALWAEVRNTFGERHDYCLRRPDGGPIGPGDSLVAVKRLHVSPFFRVEGRYRFRVRDPRDGACVVRIDYGREEGSADFSATLSGRARVLTKLGLIAPLCSSALVLLRIHWQALRLGFKRVPFFGKQGRPSDTTARRAG